MWTLALAIYAACKWLSLRAAPRVAATRSRRLAFLLAWPGMDAEAFLRSGPARAAARPSAAEWAFAAAKLAAGAWLLWGGAPRAPSELARGWLGMVGLVFALHFGLFHLLSCAWRRAGIEARPLMSWPLASTRVAEFWGERWNRAFRDLTHRVLFRPLAARLGAGAALALGFFASGLVHDLVISWPAGGGWGLPTLYFALQALAILLERGPLRAAFRRAPRWLARAWTVLWVAAPAFWLFHPPFVDRVVLPFLDAIGGAAVAK